MSGGCRGEVPAPRRGEVSAQPARQVAQRAAAPAGGDRFEIVLELTDAGSASRGAAMAALDDLAPRVAPVLLACEVRSVAADSLWLSPCYGRDTAGIHFTWRRDPAAVAALLPAIEDRLAPFAPRPHWGKLFTLAPERIRASYPRLQAFGQLMTSYDPSGKFRNAFIASIIPDGRG